MLKSTLLIFSGYFLAFSCIQAQDMATHHMVVIRDTGMLIRFSVPNVPIQLKPDRNRVYCYFQMGKIQSTQAGYSGALLDGQYEALYASKAIYAQGQFIKGEKNGNWRFWHPNGNLFREENWKKGRLHGRFAEYDVDGYKIKCGKHRKGYLHGKVHIYNKGVLLETIRYKKGEIKEKEQKWFRWPKVKKQSPQR